MISSHILSQFKHISASNTPDIVATFQSVDVAHYKTYPQIIGKNINHLQTTQSRQFMAWVPCMETPATMSSTRGHIQPNMDLKLEYKSARQGIAITNEWTKGHQDDNCAWNNIAVL